MKDPYISKSYDIKPSGVKFSTSDKALKAVFDRAEEICKGNTKIFGDYKVLIEGSQYVNVWPETQPMGGEMYAKRDIRTALNNILIFLKYQRRDGRFPGMISCRNIYDGVTAHYDWMQGFFFPYPAFKMYYLIGKDKEYLKLLYGALENFDCYLWRCRDSDGDGCLESWCIWDTGEDNFTLHLLGGMKMPQHGAYGGSEPPENYGNMPYESPQFMSYSYACRRTLSEISKILENGREREWINKAEAVKKKFRDYLWDNEKKACFSRDKNNEMLYCLTQENIKCMYGGIFSQDMADAFIEKHLLNTEEFLTPYPLPSVAINDPLFHQNAVQSNCAEALFALGDVSKGIDDNSWSGPINGLTYQRVIGALLNYGHHAEISLFGGRFLKMIEENGVFVQNYNVFSGKAAKSEDGYGPTALSALEYISLMYGVNISCDNVLWTGISDGNDYEYTQSMLGRDYTLKHENRKNHAFIDGEKIIEFSDNIRVKTDTRGALIQAFCISEGKAVLSYGEKIFEKDMTLNESYAFNAK